jgi:TonB-linked SusC/RagA family outer membrane protein
MFTVANCKTVRNCFGVHSLLPPKIWLVMKLTTILLLAFTLQVSAKGYSQATISLRLKNAPLNKVLDEIKKQSGYRIIYEKGEMAKAIPVSVEITNIPLEKALAIVFKDQPLSYNVSDKFIVVSHKDPVGPGSSQAAPVQLMDITGRVTDTKGNPIAGATVTVVGGKTTVTDNDGNFKVPATKGNKIEISVVGYETAVVTVGNENTYNVAVKPLPAKMEEVVIVGYGSQKQTNLTSSVTVVKSSSLQDRPLTNASQALQGAPGLYVNQGAGGQPGADDATIRLRGVGTLNNNDPLVLVDGIAYNLHDVNPNDIESISVLKDAAAASIYGNRAANGVILIKTKSGVKGKMQVNYDNTFGSQQTTYLPNMVTNSADFAKLYNQALANVGTVLTPGVNSYSQAQIDSFQANVGKQSDLYPSTDWYKVMLRKAFMQQHNLRFSGGTDKSTYSISLGYMDQDGVLIGTNAKKYSLSTNLAFEVTKNLNVGVNFNGAYWIQNQSPTGTGGMFNTIYRMVPIFNATLANGNYADNWLPLSLLNGQNSFRNPYVMAINGIGETKSSNILANFYAEYKLPFSLKYKANFGVTKADLYTNNFVPNTPLYNPATGVASPLDWGGIANGQPKSDQRINSNSLNTTFFQTLSWSRSIAGKHNVDVLLGNSVEDYYTANSDVYVEGIIDNNVTELSNGTINQKVSSNTSENKLLSYFGRVGYNFSNKYMAEFDFRYDGSSRFAPDHRWGFFPAMSLGWRIDQENFFSSLRDKVSSLKLRASWGQLGNQNIANFAYLPTYVNTVTQGYTFGGTNVVGAAATSLSNPDISWEKTTTTNIGLDAAFFKGRLSMTADYFNRLTTGILTPVIIPAQIGNLTGPTQNLFSMRNSGVELSLSYKGNVGKLGYSLDGNICYVDNRVVNLGGGQQINGVNIIKEGYSVNSFYLLEAIGLFQQQDTGSKGYIARHAFQGKTTSPGDIIYKSQQADTTTAISGNDRIVTGRTVPRYTYGFTLGLNYKGFDLSAFFQGVGSVNTYLNGNAIQPFNNGAGITKDWMTDSWTQTNPDASLPRLTTSKYTQNFAGIAGSTWWLRDASYLRLKNLQIGYTLPASLMHKAGINKLRLFVNAQNLLTFSKLKIVDPERVNINTNIYSYPTIKIFSGGLSLTL